MEKSVKAISLNYGLYLGGLLSLLTIAIWAIDISLMVNMWLGIGILLTVVLFGVLATSKNKSFFEGFLTFKQAFSSYFITAAVGILISQIVSLLLFNFIDPDAAIEIKKLTVETTISMMEGFGAPAENIAEAVENIENQNQFSPLNIIKSMAWAFLFQAVIGLIVALIMKKNKED